MIDHLALWATQSTSTVDVPGRDTKESKLDKPIGNDSLMLIIGELSQRILALEARLPK